MDRVGLLVAFSMLAACALAGAQIAAPKLEVPTELDLQLARCEPGEAACPMRADRFVDRRGGQAEKHFAARQPIRRVSQSGYDYGECGGMSLAVMLFPEPCDRSWRARPIPLEEAQD